jgi:SAM-dependent methyltransferase
MTRFDSDTIRLNIGCGSDILPGFVNSDIVAVPGVDVVCDLDVAPWPWPDGCAEVIHAMDVFEHLDKPLLFMTECHRILMPGGVLEIRVPDWRYENAWTDPTHKRGCTDLTFDYWCWGTELGDRHNAAYGGVWFHKRKGRLLGYDLAFSLEKKA